MKILWLAGGFVALLGFLGLSWMTMASHGSLDSFSQRNGTTARLIAGSSTIPIELTTRIRALEDRSLFVCLDRQHSSESERALQQRARDVQYQRIYDELQDFTVIHQSIAQLQIAERRCNAAYMPSLDNLLSSLRSLDRDIGRHISSTSSLRL